MNVPQILYNQLEKHLKSKGWEGDFENYMKRCVNGQRGTYNATFRALVQDYFSNDYDK